MAWNDSLGGQAGLDFIVRANSSMAPPINELSRHLAGMPEMAPLDKMLASIVFYSQMYYNPALACVGMLSNIVTCVVLPFSALYSLSAGQYLLALTVADTMFLLNMLLHWLNILGYGVYRYGSLCHFTMFLRHSARFMSLWYTVCLATDGFIVVCCPYRREKLACRTRARVVAACLAVTAVAVYLNISLTFGIIRIGQIYLCHPVHDLADSLDRLQKIDVFVNVLVPYTALIYLLLHVGIHAACQHRQGIKAYSVTRGHDNQKNVAYPLQFLFVYLTVILLLSLPSNGMCLYYSIADMVSPQGMQNGQQKRQLLTDTLLNVHNVRHAANFWILLFTSEQFRQTIAMLVVRGCKSCKRTKKTKAEKATLPEGHVSDETSLALIEAGHNKAVAV